MDIENESASDDLAGLRPRVEALEDFKARILDGLAEDAASRWAEWKPKERTSAFNRAVHALHREVMLPLLGPSIREAGAKESRAHSAYAYPPPVELPEVKVEFRYGMMPEDAVAFVRLNQDIQGGMIVVRRALQQGDMERLLVVSARWRDRLAEKGVTL